MNLEGKVAVVTGGSKGIGAAISQRLAESGATVAIIARGLEGASELAGRLTAEGGGKARAYAADCSDTASLGTVIEQIVADHGGIDILVSCAGTFVTKSVAETTEEDWDYMIDLNLKGPFFLVKMALPHLEARGGGKVVLISSIAGLRGFPNCPGYCASKGGVVNLTKALAAELASKKINVNSIAPGNVATAFNEHLRGPGSEAYVQLMADRTPTGRAFLDAKDIAGTAVFLASEEAASVHGAVITVDDGWCAW